MPFRAKCSSCRRTNEGETINDAINNMKHPPNCEFERGVATNFECIDLDIASDF